MAHRGDLPADLDIEGNGPDDDPRTFPREGWGEDIGPAVDADEWTDAREDQLTLAVDADAPVEALEDTMLVAGTESEQVDATELADTAAPAPPEEAAVTERAAIRVEDTDELTTGLPAGADTSALPADRLVEAEQAALLADELARRDRR